MEHRSSSKVTLSKLSLKGKWVHTHTPKLPQVGIQNPDVEGGDGWVACLSSFFFPLIDLSIVVKLGV